MHVSNLHKYIFLSVPHTKSTSTRKWLERYYDARQIGRPHDTGTASDRDGYFTWTIVREPCDRAAALWRKIHRKHDRPPVEKWMTDKGHAFPQSFRDFAEILASGDMNEFPNHQLRPQAELLRGISLDMTFKFESVPDELTRLPFALNEIGKFPHLTKNGLMQEETADKLFCEDPHCESLVEAWSPSDFRLWDRAL